MKSKQSTSVSKLGKQELLCPICGNSGITTSWDHIEFNYGSGDSSEGLTADVPVRRCETCDFDYLDEEAARLKHKAICRYLGVLSPDEIRRIRKGFRMTRSEFAKVTGIGEASLNRWENGLNIQTHANDRYLRLLSARSENMRDIKMFASSPSSSSPKMRFRTLKITDGLLKEQETFQLSKAA